MFVFDIGAKDTGHVSSDTSVSTYLVYLGTYLLGFANFT